MTPSGGNFPSVNDVAWAVIAILGGIARYLDSFLKGGHPPTWTRLMAHAFVSGFSGYMVAQVSLQIKPEWAFIAAGVAGYLGTQALDMVAELMRKRAGVDKPEEPKS